MSLTMNPIDVVYQTLSVNSSELEQHGRIRITPENHDLPGHTSIKIYLDADEDSFMAVWFKGKSIIGQRFSSLAYAFRSLDEAAPELASIPPAHLLMRETDGLCYIPGVSKQKYFAVKEDLGGSIADELSYLCDSGLDVVVPEDGYCVRGNPYTSGSVDLLVRFTTK